MSKSFTTHLGGTVTFTATGLIHRAGQAQYSGRLAELNQEAVTLGEAKRSRGRPRKQK
jgi:hypothetical protein